MSRIACIVGLLLLGTLMVSARHHHVDSDEPAAFPVGSLQFSIPAGWQAVPGFSLPRAGQWLVPPPHAANTMDGVQIVAYFFGPGQGGSTQENFDAWAGTITNADGSPASATPRKHTVAGHAIAEAQYSGTYAQANPQPGLPPTPKPGYALIGAVVENPAGTIYWRVTGPADQVAALVPAFDQMLDSLKPQAAP